MYKLRIFVILFSVLCVFNSCESEAPPNARNPYSTYIEAISNYPENYEDNASIDTRIIIKFARLDTDINKSTVTKNSFTVLDDNYNLIIGNIEVIESSLIFIPKNSLKENTTYEVAINSSVEDLDGYNLRSHYRFRFTTESSKTINSSKLSSPLTKTGQTISYDKYDDGYYQAGLKKRYTRYYDTVTDSSTKLMWQDNYATKQNSISSSGISYCRKLTLAGYNDWKLPTINELYTIVDYSRHDPAIDPIFENIASGYLGYRSSSVTSKFGGRWGIDFQYGINDWGGSGGVNIRCVRSQ